VKKIAVNWFYCNYRKRVRDLSLTLQAPLILQLSQQNILVLFELLPQLVTEHPISDDHVRPVGERLA